MSKFHTPLVARCWNPESPRLDLDYISSSNVLILGGGGGFAALAGALQAWETSGWRFVEWVLFLLLLFLDVFNQSVFFVFLLYCFFGVHVCGCCCCCCRCFLDKYTCVFLVCSFILHFCYLLLYFCTVCCLLVCLVVFVVFLLLMRDFAGFQLGFARGRWLVVWYSMRVSKIMRWMDCHTHIN